MRSLLLWHPIVAAALTLALPPSQAAAGESTHPGHAAAASSGAPASPAASPGDGAHAGRVAIAGEIVPHPCMPRAGTLPDELCERIGRLDHDRTMRFLRDERTGEVCVLRVQASVPPERARWLAQHGARVRVTGWAREREGLRWIEVEEVLRAHDHDAAPHGGVVGMFEDRHLELVSQPHGDVRVYLLDAFMQPLGAEDASGSARIRDRVGTERSARLRPSDDGRYLIVEGERRHPEDEDVTVDVDVRGSHVTMTLPFAPDHATDGHTHGDPHGSHGHH